MTSTGTRSAPRRPFAAVVAAAAAGVGFGLSLAARVALRRDQPARRSAQETAVVEGGALGRSADQPADLPWRGWAQVLRRVKTEMRNDNVSLLGAGVAFFTFLALAPALAALVSVYGLVADPDEVQSQVGDFLVAAPAEVRTLVVDQLETVAGSTSSSLGVAAVVGVVAALWSASAAIKHLIGALNAAYDETETRGFVQLRAVSLGLTVGGVAIVSAVVFVAAAVPSLLDGTSLELVGTVLRWPLLAVVLVVSLAVLYRFAPDRSAAEWAWTAPGTISAAVLLVVASIGFSVYTANFGSYGETYGSFSAVVVSMLWLMICATVVILGAEINAEAERQTLEDSTVGPDQPIGERGADPADDAMAGHG